MNQQTSSRYRDVGPAEHRYSSPESISKRREVAREIRKISEYNHSDWILPDWDRFARREQALKRQAGRYETCGLQYIKVGCTDCGHVFIGPRRCETRICESCARKYGARIRRKQMEVVMRLNYEGGRRLMFLTLTKKTHPLYRPRSSDVRLVFKHTRKLISSLWPKKQGCGAFAVMEVGKGNNLHVHLIVYGHYVPQDAISKLWLKITGDSYVVWINQSWRKEKLVNYLLKYITKPDPRNNPEEIAQYLDMMLGVRRIRTYGIFYNHRVVTADTCPCPLCGGRLRFAGFDEGRGIPSFALFFEEAFELAKLKAN